MYCSTDDIFDSSETTILRQKLKSKTEALFILNKELEKLRIETEEYKELIQKLQSQNSEIRLGETLSAEECGAFRDKSVGQHFSIIREDNKRLIVERENLRCKLQEKEEEVRLIREQRLKDKNRRKEENGKKLQSEEDYWEDTDKKDSLLKELESLQVKYNSLKLDLQSILDEKEDLVNERDAYKGKVHRLNHALNALLKSDGYKTMDLDCLISENRFLQQRAQQVQEEKELANEMGRRYKSALEKNKNGILGIRSDRTHDKELKRLIVETSFPCPKALDLNDVKSMQELCHNLLETLNDRMTQLKHQRRANKHLLERLSQLEDKLYARENGELLLWPSHYLMKGYNPSELDHNSDIVVLDPEGDYSPELEELFQKFQELSAVTSTDGESEFGAEKLRPTAPLPILPGDSSGEDDGETEEDGKALPPHLKILVEEALNNLDSVEDESEVS